ncbi:DUF4402 domain-containing protein [Mucilaginibacter ginkgonis]|uniref:DUF4402 domain-containing protein n=1 Tax=Mucilaginibacter ginkgonis TaxID=2682091 RepID=A0A6I4INN3_9SPHI|nr:DUF4402 domain-containing protein [Mucilaginibacter ginkgonis]QQL48893.1 DUF4402 domain-containing protein [Mucilaginibacter ginkgonis]
MKKVYLLFFIVTGFVIAGSRSAKAQASATATSTANIVTPISIAKTADMAFGNLSTSGTAGTVVLTPAGSRTKTGGVTLPATTGTVAAAAFTVSGVAAYTYAITLPSGTVTLSSGANTMTISTFTSNPGTTGTLSAGGTQTLSVGATLNVGASQAAGTYTTGASPFTVTVNYN